MVPPKHWPLPPPMNVGIRCQYGQVVVLHKVAIKTSYVFARWRQIASQRTRGEVCCIRLPCYFQKTSQELTTYIRRLLVSKKTTSGKIQLCCVKLNRVSLFFVLNSATYRTTSDLWTVVMITTKWSSDIVGNAQYCVTGNREIGLDMTYTVRTFSTIMTKLARYRTQCTLIAVVNAECWLLNRLRLWRVIFTIRLYHTSSKTLFVYLLRTKQ